MKKVALLAPVPEVHLLSGMNTLASEGKLAFGSSAWGVFRELDERTAGMDVDVYIYASESSKPGPPKVLWRASYLGHVESRNGAHPDGMTYRPQSTRENAQDNRGHWAIFWEIDGLQELQKDEAIPMNLFRGLSSGKPFVSSFVPHGPTLVEEL